MLKKKLRTLTGREIRTATGLPFIECMVVAKALVRGEVPGNIPGAIPVEYPCECCGIEYYYLNGPKGEYRLVMM